MKMNIIYVILSSLLLLGSLSSVDAQTVRPEAKVSNLILSAVERYNAKDIEGALALLKEAVAENPEEDAAWYYIAECAILKNDAEMAEQGLRMAVEIDPANFWYRYKLARLYSLTSRPELTVDMYEKLLEDFPKKSELYFDLVELYASQQEYEKALATISEIETVLGMTESIAMYRFNLLLRLDRKQDAYKSLEDYNSKYSSPHVLSALAEQYLSEYQDSVALNYYNEALELAPDYGPAMIGKAEVMRMAMKYD
jgi:tetratricopeptide (TPR) repeat protein